MSIKQKMGKKQRKSMKAKVIKNIIKLINFQLD